MKKISKKDLSLQRETVSSLSSENSGDIVENTISCNISLCRDCPTATFATVCTPCETGVNCKDTMNEQTCAQTEAHCPPDPTIELSKVNPDACLLTAEFCETKNICPNTNGNICETKNRCETRNNCETNADCEAVTISIAIRCLTKPCP